MSILPLPANRWVTLLAEFSFAGTHLNRFTYLADTPTIGTSELLSFIQQFDTTVAAAIRQLQVSALVWTLYRCEVNLSGGAYAELSLPAGGAVSGDGMPPYVTYSFRFLRPGTGVRGGFKRFSGVPEAYVANGAWVGANPPATAVNNVISALTANISVAGVVYTPIVPITTFNGQPLPEPHYYIPLGAQLRPVPGTQLTRK